LRATHLTASFNAQSCGGRVEGGYCFATVCGLTPYAAIQSQTFHTPGYTETALNGGGFALAYNSRTGSDTRSELGIRFDRVLALYTNAVLSLRARLASAYDRVSDPTLAVVFQTLPGAGFIVNGATPAKNSALASAGSELRLANGGGDRGGVSALRSKPPSEPRHSTEQARNHHRHSGDEYSQARKQQKVAQEYRHTPASRYLLCAGHLDTPRYLDTPSIVLGLLSESRTITDYLMPASLALSHVLLDPHE
jgi:hypothetical protein